MLSYLHGYHAGNHADVLKHSILSIVLSRLIQKKRPVTYMDTHAGAGYYNLNGERSLKTGEAASGILKLLDRSDIPDLLVPYLTLCDRLYKENKYYPGSPAIAAALTRPDDNIILMELHPAEYTKLKNIMSSDTRIHVHNRDGFPGLIALSPPEHRRGIVLIDPSYETDEDYTKVANAVYTLVKRWPEAAIAVWYPLVQRRIKETEALKKSIALCTKNGALCTELSPSGHGDSAWGLYGSGMLIVNPPWKTDEEIAASLPWITEMLAVDSQATTAHGWIT